MLSLLFCCGYCCCYILNIVRIEDFDHKDNVLKIKRGKARQDPRKTFALVTSGFESWLFKICVTLGELLKFFVVDCVIVKIFAAVSHRVIPG